MEKVKKPLILRISTLDKILFAKHLALMINSGLPLVEALSLLKRQVKSGSMAYVLDRVIKDIENGQFLADSLNRFRNVFGDLYISIIKVAETSGTLPENLEYLAVELKRALGLRRKIISSLIYPAIILVATIAIAFILIFLVFPKLLPVFDSLNIDLPLPTVIFISVARFLIKYGLFLIVGLIVGLFGLTLLLRIRQVRFVLHMVTLHLPIIGGLAKKAAMVEFCRTLGILLKSGVKIVEAIELTASGMNNLVYRKILKQASEFVRGGHPLYTFIDQYKGLFFFNVSRMIEVGEATGSLEHNLAYLADYYEEDVVEGLANLSNTIEPFLLIVMGLSVGFIALAIITPIYKLTEKFNR
jgi:type IV pilus assembly protein PilC